MSKREMEKLLQHLNACLFLIWLDVKDVKYSSNINAKNNTLGAMKALVEISDLLGWEGSVCKKKIKEMEEGDKQ